mgnify:CR=1 FL=1
MTKYKKIIDVNGRHNYHMTLENGNEFYVSGDVGDYIKSLEEAITDTHCCKSDSELLKDKENLSFKGWMRTKGYEKNNNEPWLKDDKICTGSEIRYMLEQYKTL